MDMPLDAATVMVSSIALGIAVDDTVHMLWTLRNAKDESEENFLADLDSIGPALIITTLTISAGFLVLNAADFTPIRQFGTMATLAMLIALLADILVLPAIVFAAPKFWETSIERK